MTTDHFDEKAATWDDDPAKVERAQVVAQAIRAAIPLDPATRVLEYGAGTGLVSHALRDSVGPITMADTSAGMRAVMHRKVAEGVLPNARVWDLDLSTGTAPDERFDLIVTVLTLHHITDLEPVLAAFATLLDDGGHLCIVDLEEEDGSFHTGEFGGHHGFGQAGLRSLLEGAGFRDISFQRCHQIERDSGTYPLFLAIAHI